MPGLANVAPGAVEQDASALPKHGVRDRTLVLQGRSLVNTLNVLKRKLGALKGRAVTAEDLAHYQRVLDDIDGRWRDGEGTFAGRLAPADPRTAALASRTFNECFDALGALRHAVVEMPPELKELHTRLVDLQARLARMQADPDHTLAEVLPLQAALDGIDAERLSRGGSWAAGTDTAAPGETACNELINHCYELLAGALRGAEDVDEAMKAVYDELRGVKNALRQLAGKRHHTVEDLRLYQARLERVDAARVDGVFCGDLQKGVVPHGQAGAAKLLGECFDLAEGLAEGAEDLGADHRAVHARLEAARHELEGMLRRQCTHAELRRVQAELDGVDDERQAHAGVWARPDDAGTQTLSTLLNHDYRLLHDLMADVAAAEQ